MKALLLIDLQNDYFPNGAFPLWNTEATLVQIEKAMDKAQAQDIPVIHIQHLADPSLGLAPFFNPDTEGASIHPRILAKAPHAPIITKHYADSFEQTTLEQTLKQLQVTELLMAGMMTQNCVTHTALSKTADQFHPTILTDCCTTVSEILHLIALHAASTRVTLSRSEAAF